MVTEKQQKRSGLRICNFDSEMVYGSSEKQNFAFKKVLHYFVKYTQISNMKKQGFCRRRKKIKGKKHQIPKCN